jgi:hypothetical protein
MELFKRNSKVQRFVIIKKDVIQDIMKIAIPKQLTGISLLIKAMSRKSLSTINSTHSINKAVLCSVSNDVSSISEALKSLDEETKINADPFV